MNIWVCDYFAGNCIYNEEAFDHRFRINKEVFLRISNTLEARCDFLAELDLEVEWALLLYRNVQLHIGI